MTDQALKAAVEEVTALAVARADGAKREAFDCTYENDRRDYAAGVLESATVVVPYASLRTLLAALSSQASVMEEMRGAFEAKRKLFEDRSGELKPGSPARHFVSGRENGLCDAICILDQYRTLGGE